MNKELILDFLTIIPNFWKKMLILEKENWFEKLTFDEFLKYYCKNPKITNQILNDFKNKYKIYLSNWDYFERIYWLKNDKDLKFILKLENLNINWFKRFLSILEKEPFYCEKKYLFFYEEEFKNWDFLTISSKIIEKIYFNIKKL